MAGDAEKISKLEAEISDLNSKVAVLTTRMDSAKDREDENHKSVLRMIESLVTKVEFTPVKLIAYGLASTIMSSVLLAILSKVFTK